MILPVTKLKPRPWVLSLSVPPPPKAQGGKRGHPRKTMVSSTTGPTQTCPFCSAPYVEPAASTRQGARLGVARQKK